MRKLTLLFLIICAFNQPFILNAQYSVSKESAIAKKVYIGLGFGFGVFYPSDVNEYITANTQYMSITDGYDDMLLNLAGRVLVTYRLNRIVDITLYTEFATAPKFILLDNDDNYYYHFDKFTPGVSIKFHKLIGSGRHSLFIAPGLNYNLMKFEEYSAGVLGARLEGGISLNFGGFNMQPFVCADYAKAVDNGFELNYTGVQFGLNIGF